MENKINTEMNVHTSTDGITVEQVQNDQHVETNVKNTTEKTEHVNTANVGMNIGKIDKGDGIAVSSNDSGIQHTATKMGENVTSKRDKMASSSAQNDEVSRGTGHVGSYADDAQTNGVHHIDARRDMIETSEKTINFSTQIQMKQIDRINFSAGGSGQKVKLNPDELMQFISEMNIQMKETIAQVIEKQGVIKQLTSTAESDYTKRQEDFVNAFNTFLNNEFHKNELQYEVGNLMLDMLRTQIPDIESIMVDLGINAYKVTTKPLKIISKFNRLYLKYQEKIREKLMIRMAENEMIVEADAAAAAIFEATVVLMPIGIVLDIIGAIIMLQSAIDSLLTFGILAGGGTLMMIAYPMTDLDEKLAGETKKLPTIGKSNASGIEDPIVVWMNQHNTLTTYNINKIEDNTNSMSNTMEAIVRDFTDMDKSISKGVAAGVNMDTEITVSAPKLTELIDESVIVDENIQITLNNQILGVTQDVLNSDVLSDFQKFANDCNQLENMAQIHFLVKMCETIKFIHDQVVFNNNTLNSGLDWVESILNEEWLKLALHLTPINEYMIKGLNSNIRKGISASEHFANWFVSSSEEVLNLPSKFQKIESLASSSSAITSRTESIMKELVFDATYGTTFTTALSASNDASEMLQSGSKMFTAYLENISSISEGNAILSMTKESAAKMEKDLQVVSKQFAKIV